VDINVTRTEQERRSGFLGIFGIGKSFTVYHTKVTIGLDEKEAEDLENFLKDNSNDFSITYSMMVGSSPSKGYFEAPPGQFGEMQPNDDGGMPYVGSELSILLSDYKKGKQTSLVSTAFTINDQEDWIEQITNNLERMKKMVEMFKMKTESIQQNEHIKI